MHDLERKRLTTRVLELLDASARAHAEGRRDESSALMQQACETDVAVVSVVRGGIIIGQIPHPQSQPHEWAEYLDANREELARMEQGWPGGGTDGH